MFKFEEFIKTVDEQKLKQETIKNLPTNKTLMVCLKIEQEIVEKCAFEKIKTPNFVGYNDFYTQSDYFVLAFRITNPKNPSLANKIILINASNGKLYILESLSKEYPTYSALFSIKVNSFMSIDKFLNQVDQNFLLPKFSIYKDCKEQILDFLNKVLIKKTIYKLQQSLQDINFFEKELIANYSFYKNSVVKIKIPSTAIINLEIKTDCDNEHFLFVVRNAKKQELVNFRFNPKLPFDKFIEYFNKTHFFDKEKADELYHKLEREKWKSLNSLISDLQDQLKLDYNLN